MSKYRCYYLEDRQIHASVDIEATDDPAAVVKAELLLTESPLTTMEIQQGPRFVGRVTLGSPAALMDREGSEHTPERR
jgi:hypothetical protein